MTSELKLCEWCGSATPCSDGACPLKRNTHAVPDVPELVRYDWCRTRMMVEVGRGEYVRYDQAVAVIAADRQAAIDARNLLQYEKDQQWRERAEAAEAELAQYLQK